MVYKKKMTIPTTLGISNITSGETSLSVLTEDKKVHVYMTMAATQ